MAGITRQTTLSELTKGSQGNALTIPIAARQPLDAATQRQVTQAVVSDIKRRFLTSTAPDGSVWRPLKYPRPRGGNKPLMDTGRLMASITGTSTPTEIVVGTAHPAANLQHYGGTVRPKRGKYLAIPRTRQAQRAGSPRRMKGTPAVPLFARMVEGQWVGHFILARQAVVPARAFMGLSAAGLRVVEAILADAAARQWERGR